MESQRYVNLACQQGYLKQEELDRARSLLREEEERGGKKSLWAIIQDLGLLSQEQIREVEQAFTFATHNQQQMIVDGYQIEERLGSGGMGDVFLARRVDDPDQQVAIKMLPRRLCSDPEHLQRFVREAKALEQLSDVHITSYIAAGEIDARPYLIMELVRGPSLKDHFQQAGALTQLNALHILAQLSQALIKAEELRVVHRDLKPANILLAPARQGQNEPFCAKICDFGLVKFLQDRADSLGVDEGLTLSGIALGTPHYMSPEQATGERAIDHRSDMYSLAATLYHAMMGRTLFSGKTSAIIMYKQVTAAIDVEPLRERGCDPLFIDLLRDMLRKEPEQRPHSWREVAARAREIVMQNQAGPQAREVAIPLRDQVAATHASAMELPAPVVRSRKQTVLALQLCGSALIILAAILGWAIFPPGEGARSLRADPQNIEAVIAQARSDLESMRSELLHPSGSETPLSRRIRLEAGQYQVNWHWDSSFSGLHLYAAGPGVVLDGGNDTLLHLAEGTQNIVLKGPLSLRSQAAQIVVIESGASLSAQRLRIDGPGQIICNGGQLEVENGRMNVGITALDGSEVLLRHSMIDNPQHGVYATGSLVILDHFALYGRQALALRSGQESPLLWLHNSTLRAQVLLLEGSRQSIALRSESCPWVDIQQARLLAQDNAWHSIDSIVGVARYLSLAAGRVGLDWQGRHDSEWSWSEIAIDALQPTLGISLMTDGVGADPQQLRNLLTPESRE